MPRYLVTGAAGFIGSNLVLALEASGAEVTAVDCYRTGAKENLSGFRGKMLETDISQKGVPTSEPWDAVFHQGDITDPRHPSDDEVLERNIAGFNRVLSIARESRCRLIYASTAGLYGNGPTPMQEDQPKQLLTAYAKSKWQMDELGREDGSGISIVGLRYFNVYGPREASKGRAASMVYHLYRQIKAGETPRLFEHGHHKRDFIYVKDVVSANLLALKAPKGVYNVGTGQASTFNELVEALGAAFGRKIPIEYFPMPYDATTYQSDTQAGIEHSLKSLGFQAKWGLTQGVADYVRWLESPSLVNEFDLS
jgi:ADP-L-glycero-D-manno-heptose 6-epimerase